MTKIGVGIVDARELSDEQCRIAIENAETMHKTVIVIRYDDVDIEGSRVHVL